MVFTESTYPSDWLKGEQENPKDFSREAITVLAGEAIRNGTVLGAITASGKYAQVDPAATDGSETAAGILFTREIAGDTVADEPAVAIVRNAVINPNNLIWPDGISDNDKAAALAELAELGILAREGA